jgi:hypothetical protein
MYTAYTYFGLDGTNMGMANKQIRQVMGTADVPMDDAGRVCWAVTVEYTIPRDPNSAATATVC